MKSKQLLELKQQIEDKKSSISEYRGKRLVILENLKKNWDCSSLEESSDLLKKLRMELHDLKHKEEKDLRKLQKQLKE